MLNRTEENSTAQYLLKFVRVKMKCFNFKLYV